MLKVYITCLTILCHYIPLLKIVSQSLITLNELYSFNSELSMKHLHLWIKFKTHFVHSTFTKIFLLKTCLLFLSIILSFTFHYILPSKTTLSKSRYFLETMCVLFTYRCCACLHQTLPLFKACSIFIDERRECLDLFYESLQSKVQE